MSKFKVGDRVKHAIASTGEYFFGTVREITVSGIKVELDIGSEGVTLRTGGKTYFGWHLPEYEWKLANENTSKILITSDGTTTTARLYNGKKVIKSSEAKCAPSDTYDFTIGANLAYDRLMRPTQYKPQDTTQYREVKREAKVGETVRVLDHAIGTAGDYRGETVDVVAINHVGYPLFKDYKHDSTYRANLSHSEYVVLEPIVQREPIQLYCVKDWNHGDYQLIKGGVYSLDTSGRFVYENGKKTYDTFTDAADVVGTWLGGFLVPLVKRPAVVGEWVYMLSDMGGCLKKGSINKCIKENFFGNGCFCLFEYKSGEPEYLVLDGYTADDLSNYEWVDGYKGFDENLCCRGFQYEVGKEYDLGEEEKVCSKGFHFCMTLEEVYDYYSNNGKNRFCKVSGFVKKGSYDGKWCARKIKIVEEVTEPKRWSGKVICVSSTDCGFTDGVVYTVREGKVTDDDCTVRPTCKDGFIKSLDDMTKWCYGKFILHKGEQS